jgi:nicotinate phosphoribosyltransferase
MGKRLKGVRIDSGDLAYLSKESRKLLDEAGLEDCKIVASNGLDEYTIRSLIHQGAEIDSFGVGERLITSASNPVFGAVYKLAAIKKGGKFIPKIKVSETAEKITDPGLKKIYRVYNKEGKAIADYLACYDEKIDSSKPVRYIDPQKYWKERSFENCTFKNLQVKVIEDGKQIYQCPSVEEIRSYVQRQLKEEIWVEEQRFENPHGHYYDMSPAMYELKMSLLYTLGKAK